MCRLGSYPRVAEVCVQLLLSAALPGSRGFRDFCKGFREFEGLGFGV